MRLADMAQAFVEGREKCGCIMRVVNEEDKTMLYYGSDAIASISDRTSDGYRLHIYGRKADYADIGLNNRLNAVLRVVQKPISPESKWYRTRYSAHSRYGNRLWDSLTDTEIRLPRDHCVMLSFTAKPNGLLYLDYSSLEAQIANASEWQNDLKEAYGQPDVQSSAQVTADPLATEVNELVTLVNNL